MAMLLDLSMQQCTDTLKSVVYLVFGIKKKKINEELPVSSVQQIVGLDVFGMHRGRQCSEKCSF